MRLAVDCTSLIGSRTGIGNVTAELLRRLPRPDVDVSAFAVTRRGASALLDDLPSGITAHRRPMVARPLRFLWRNTDHPAIERWTGNIDVVWGPNFVVPPARSAAEVVTVHDLTCIFFPEMCTKDTLQVPALLRRAIQRGAWIHAVSNSVANEVIDIFGANPERVMAIHNGGPAPAAPHTIAELAARGRGLVGAENYIAFVGTSEPRKDIPSLIRAFNSLGNEFPSLHLVIAGPDGWSADAVTAAINQSPLKKRIIRTGWLTNDDRDALIAGATVLAYPSLLEGFGLPPLEAMALDTPVVTTNVGALPEVLGEAAVFCSPNDSDSLARAIGSLLANESARADLIAKGRERSKMYSWDRSSDNLVELFRTAAANR